MPALSSQFNFNIKQSTSTNTSTVHVDIPSAYVSVNNNTLFNSIREKGDGYFGAADGLHTVTYTVTPNFAGTLTMQATLAVDPIESDWFNVVNTAVTYRSPIIPTTTTTSYVNFTGNFVWVRAQVYRSLDQPNGSVRFINYNH
jgi:hypothetical protein